MNVQLFKKNANYKDKDGNEKTATNFFVKCGDMLIPVEPKYFPDKETDKDSMFFTRKTVLSSFAEVLPEKNQDKENT